jgi:hypothetical protein
MSSSLADTIAQSMMRIGPGTRDKVRDIYGALGGLDLAPVERLSALATAVAAMATIFHARHVKVYFEAIRTWSLEISNGIAPAPCPGSTYARGGRVADAADIILAGLDAVMDDLRTDRVGLQDRLVLELALFAQLLGQHDANAILLTLRAVAEAIGDDGYQPGGTILVPLGELWLPLRRDACLADLAPRGVA